jgi:hypothetical protein
VVEEDRLQVAADRTGHEFVRQHYGLVERTASVDEPKQGAGRAQQFAGIALGLLGERRAQLFVAAEQQIVLALVVGVERGAADVGAVEDVLHGDALVALLQGQLEQGPAQQFACSTYPPVGHRELLLEFPDSFRGGVRYRTPPGELSLAARGRMLQDRTRVR